MSKFLIGNKKALFNYEFEEKYEAGISLKGTEVKSIIKSNADLTEAFIIERNLELFVINMYVAPFEQGNIFNVDSTRTRKLLLHKNEILKISHNIKKNKLTIIPLDIHLSRGKIKLTIAIGKRKNAKDKRETLKKRDDLREARNY